MQYPADTDADATMSHDLSTLKNKTTISFGSLPTGGGILLVCRRLDYRKKTSKLDLNKIDSFEITSGNYLVFVRKDWRGSFHDSQILVGYWHPGNYVLDYSVVSPHIPFTAHYSVNVGFEPWEALVDAGGFYNSDIRTRALSDIRLDVFAKHVLY